MAEKSLLRAIRDGEKRVTLPLEKAVYDRVAAEQYRRFLRNRTRTSIPKLINEILFNALPPAPNEGDTANDDPALVVVGNARKRKKPTASTRSRRLAESA